MVLIRRFEKGQYYIRVNDADKLTNNFKYVQISEVDGTEMLVVAGKETATPFYLKEVNCDETVFTIMPCWLKARKPVLSMLPV